MDLLNRPRRLARSRVCLLTAMSNSDGELPGGDQETSAYDSTIIEFDQLSGNPLPPDPLLRSGSFIDPNVESANPNGEVKSPASESKRRRRPVADLYTAADEVPPSGRTRRSDEEVAAEGKPSWLPENWTVVTRTRTSGTTAGTVDWYYLDPVEGRRFRSKKEVLHFLETGTKPKKRPSSDDAPSQGPGASNKKKPGSKAKDAATFSFDFKNPPEHVSWFLTDASEGQWSPSIGAADNLPESTKQQWATVFDRICKACRNKATSN